jgi:predicted kinase
VKLVILRGLPGSGKSTRARELVDTLGYKRVNKDDLRSMIDNGRWSSENEDIINLAQAAIVTMLMEQREPIVVDNTHGAEKQVRRLKAIAEAAEYEVVIEVIDTPIDTCIRRDSTRHASVGENVIRNMAESTPFFRTLYGIAS